MTLTDSHVEEALKELEWQEFNLALGKPVDSRKLIEAAKVLRNAAGDNPVASQRIDELEDENSDLEDQRNDLEDRVSELEEEVEELKGKLKAAGVTIDE